METQNNSKTKVVLISLAVLIVLAAVVTFSEKGIVKSSISKESINTKVEDKSSLPLDLSANYKDGDYKAVGTYMSPGGQDQIEVSVTLKNNIITVVKGKTVIADEVSQKFQDDFFKNYEASVVGKSIQSLKLDKVSGASLTPIGFNDALNKIRTESKS